MVSELKNLLVIIGTAMFIILISMSTGIGQLKKKRHKYRLKKQNQQNLGKEH